MPIALRLNFQQRATMKFGIDRLLAEPALRAPLKGRRVALLAHPASVTRDLTHSLDALAACGDIKLTAAFGPQHGLRGDKQDNMVESPDFTDPVHGIPVFSLYGEVRKPTDAMMEHLRCPARRSAGSGLPHLHLRHDAALRAGSGGEARQGGVGAGSPQSRRPAGRRPDAATRLGKLCRRRADADAPRAHARRTGPVVHQRRSSSMSSIASSRCRAGGPMPRRDSAGRSASAPGSIPVPTRRICGWRAPMPAR